MLWLRIVPLSSMLLSLCLPYHLLLYLQTLFTFQRLQLPILSLYLSLSQSSFYLSRGLFYVLYIYTVSSFSLEAEIRSVQMHVGIYLCCTLLQCFRWWSLHKPYFKWYSVVLVSVTVTLTEKVSLLVELCVGSLVKQFDIDNT